MTLGAPHDLQGAVYSMLNAMPMDQTLEANSERFSWMVSREAVLTLQSVEIRAVIL